MIISAVTFVHNEGDKIGNALENLAPYVDEVLICDLESTDNTVDVAYNYTKNIYRVPHLLCGDSYKQFLTYTAKGDWLLWFYGDELFSKSFLESMRKFADSQDYDAYQIMRHEYRDGTRLMPHGTSESPNYQNRFHRKGKGIFYSELVHAELHGQYRSCPLPPEYWMEHRKTNVDQEIDNFRLYVWMNYLIWKYRDTKVEPYKTYIRSYRQIISESEAKNETGERMIHPAEEVWWEWWKFKDHARIPIWTWATVKKELEAVAKD